MNNKEAALNAGYPIEVARVASKKIETPIVRRRMMDILDQMGLSDRALVADLKAGLREANKTQNIGTKYIMTPDYGIRHKYLETALKLKGELQGEKKEKEPIQILIVDYESNKDKSAT